MSSVTKKKKRKNHYEDNCCIFTCVACELTRQNLQKCDSAVPCILSHKQDKKELI